MKRLFIIAFLIAYPAVADEIWGAGLWAYSKDGIREIPTNRWFWIEVEPGFFVPEGEAERVKKMIEDDGSKIADEMALFKTKLEYVEKNRPVVAEEMRPSLWCMEWLNADHRPRQSCIDALPNDVVEDGE